MIAIYGSLDAVHQLSCCLKTLLQMGRQKRRATKFVCIVYTI